MVVPTTLAIFYTQALQQAGRGARGGGRARGGARGARGGRGGANPPSAEMQLQALADACERLTADFGKCNTPWGDINRFQRLNDDINPSFDDSKPSIPIGCGARASRCARSTPSSSWRAHATTRWRRPSATSRCGRSSSPPASSNSKPACAA